MTLAAHDHEIWSPEDGAPAGPAFDVMVESKSRPGRQYRIARGLDGFVYHSPPCEAWQHGRRMCRHVRSAISLTEAPDGHLAGAVLEAMKGWALLVRRAQAGDEAAAESLVAMLTGIERQAQATNYAALLKRERDAHEAERSAKTPEQRVDEAVSMFGSQR